MFTASININSSYLVIASVAYIGAIGIPIFRWTKSRLQNRGDDQQFNQRVDRTLWGAKPSRYEPNPPAGIVLQMESNSKSTTDLAKVVLALVERFEAHVAHPPGKE